MIKWAGAGSLAEGTDTHVIVCNTAVERWERK